MIKQAVTKKRNSAVTSDQWHVVHAKWAGDCVKDPNFARTIVSEHGDRTRAVTAANDLASRVGDAVHDRPREQRDQIFVRPPNFKSLKVATRRVPKRRP